MYNFITIKGLDQIILYGTLMEHHVYRYSNEGAHHKHSNMFFAWLCVNKYRIQGFVDDIVYSYDVFRCGVDRSNEMKKCSFNRFHKGTYEYNRQRDFDWQQQQERKTAVDSVLKQTQGITLKMFKNLSAKEQENIMDNLAKNHLGLIEAKQRELLIQSHRAFQLYFPIYI